MLLAKQREAAIIGAGKRARTVEAEKPNYAARDPSAHLSGLDAFRRYVNGGRRTKEEVQRSQIKSHHLEQLGELLEPPRPPGRGRE